MKTLRLKPEDYAIAARILQNGGLVALPTETVYGLAANGLDRDAVARIYEVKGRPDAKPLSLLVAGEDALAGLCADVPEEARLLARKFWPGPLTMVLKKSKSVPDIVTAGGQTVGVRCPDNITALSIINEAGYPLAAPSANVSGRESAVTAEEVLSYFDGLIDAVVDGGSCRLGTESTVIDLTRQPAAVLRQGAVSPDKLYAELAGIGDKMLVVGITGGSGSGKTTAMNSLSRFGAKLTDCDELYHRLLSENEGMKSEIAGRFKDAVNGGQVDTKKLGRAVFSDKEALLELNRITHRYVGEEVARVLKEHRKAGGRFFVIDAIALLESGLGELCDLTVGVVAPDELRLRRLMARENVSRDYARMRLSAQKPDSFFRESCDFVVENTYNDAGIFADVFAEQFWNILTGRADQCRKKTN